MNSEKTITEEILMGFSPKLNGKDLVSCMLVSKQWRDVARDDYLWKCLYEKISEESWKTVRTPKQKTFYARHRIYWELIKLLQLRKRERDIMVQNRTKEFEMWSGTILVEHRRRIHDEHRRSRPVVRLAAEHHHSPESIGSDLDTTSLSLNSPVVAAGIPRSTTSSTSETTITSWTTSSSTFPYRSHSSPTAPTSSAVATILSTPTLPPSPPNPNPPTRRCRRGVCRNL
ncbi:hypothetical protein Drorol1_Dr00013912, partial [Drosera rotundifolia]